MYKILVTGGAGFIGSHTCLTLLLKGYELVVVDSLKNSDVKSLKNVKKILDGLIPNNKNNLDFFIGDLKNIAFINNVFLEEEKKGFPINGVIHFAGLKAVKESVKNPLIYWDNNLLGTMP